MEILNTIERTMVTKTGVSLGKNVIFSYEVEGGGHPNIINANVQLTPVPTADGSPMGTMQSLNMGLTWDKVHNVNFNSTLEIAELASIMVDVDLKLHEILDSFITI